MSIHIKSIKDKIINGDEITKDEALQLYAVDEEDYEILYDCANEIRKHFMGSRVDLCTIMNAKSGKCSEDCKYCAQSAHYRTGVVEYPLISKEKAIERALENASYGVDHFSLVTSGRGLSGKDFDEIVEIYRYLNEKVPRLRLCASLGIITTDQARRLKEVGVRTYHHNLETSEDYYKEICSTHPYSDRLTTISNAQEAGLSVCSGCIIGMGENEEDRIELAFKVKELGIRSVPINVLNPIKGTPMEGQPTLEPLEILKNMAIFRFILPKAFIRYAGGRNALKNLQAKGFEAGINAALVGNYLTTVGNKINEDIEMVRSKGFEYNR
ncbi:biotin synthase BioB [Vallitalea okinawensis]|uniref:biotin synthase BioB n=1 Tax=Vallitalea okinawensis TaxID=2078660 RepID=UPI000CFDA5D3|nr:biotin synthase BioB [Vallitalea okinawensis]